MQFNQDTELIEALAAMYPNSKRNTLRKMLTSGRVTVDGKVVHKAKFIVEKEACGSFRQRDCSNFISTTSA